MATEYVRKNAVIDDTMLGWEDHGIFTFLLGLNYGGSHQGAGGLCLSGGRPTKYMARGLELVADILKTVGVEQWEKLKGRSVVALIGDDGWNSPVLGLASFIGDRQVIFAEYA